MTIRREFLGWDRPGLMVAADYLLQGTTAGAMVDLAELVVVVPGARAGRRLLEILIDRAEELGCLLQPPRIIQVGDLPGILAPPPPLPVANRLECLCAWARVLSTSAPMHAFMANLPTAEEPLRWLALGELFHKLRGDLAGENLDFAGVLARVSTIPGFEDLPRWRALVRAEASYLEILQQAHRADPYTGRLQAVRDGACRTEQRVVLVGTADLNGLACQMLDQVTAKVTALVLAPAELADRFDACGRVIAETWIDTPLDIPADRITVAGGPAEQAAEVLQAMTAWNGKYSAEQISIGVPDPALVPFLQQQLEQAGVASRFLEQTTVPRSSPGMLLSAVVDYLDQGLFHNLASLARHPDLDAWLARKIGSGVRPGDCLLALDRYYMEHLPTLVDGIQWQDVSPRYTLVADVHRALTELLHDLLSAGRVTRPLQAWAAPLANLVGEVYGGRMLHRHDPADGAVVSACETLREAICLLRDAAPALTIDMTAADALRWLLGAVANSVIPPDADGVAVELLGWLELPLDDAPALVVTGMNEGLVPSSVSADMFLPNHLRVQLGLMDNDHRLARDAYALSYLFHSRPELQLLAGRRAADGSPLIPSRLLFACSREELAGRVSRLFAPPRPVAQPHGWRAGVESQFRVPELPALAAPLDALRVTAFRSYLACPYRFYLQHILKLSVARDSAEDLDPGQFGSLAHELLDQFGQETGGKWTHVDQIQKYLSAGLDALAKEKFGGDPLAAIRIQMEQLRLRLNAFARWQADWSAQGWRIEHTELDVTEQPAPFVVDGVPVMLRGRVDRVDLNERTGERVVFDYKTGDSGKAPDKTHRIGGEWVDLQLPLYRRLIAVHGITEEVQLGYILLPKDVRRAGAAIADWSADELASADETARQVIRDIRAGIFWPPTRPAPAFSEDFAFICQDDQFGGQLAGTASDE